MAGAVKHEELVKLAEKAFGGVKALKGSAHFFWLRLAPRPALHASTAPSPTSAGRRTCSETQKAVSQVGDLLSSSTATTKWVLWPTSRRAGRLFPGRATRPEHGVLTLFEILL